MYRFLPALSPVYVIRTRDAAAAARARAERENDRHAERRLKGMVSRPRIRGHKFRHQHVYSECSLDFACVQLRLNVEVDGPHHTARRDAKREWFLRQSGWFILRIANRATTRRHQRATRDLIRRCICYLEPRVADLPTRRETPEERERRRK